MKHRIAVLAAFFAFSIASLVGCTKNSPSGPSEDTEEVAAVATAAASVPTPTPVTTPVVVTSGCEEDATAVVKVLDFSAAEGTMTAKNTGKCTNWVGLSSYLVHDNGQQEFLGKDYEDFKQLAPGATASFKVKLACGDNQVDGSAGLKKSPGNGPNGVPNFARAFLPVPQFGGNLIYRPCVTPTPTPPPTPPPNCTGYQAPTITGDISMSVGVNQATMTSGNVGPAGGTFNPSLPAIVNVPNAGQSAANFSTTYTVKYGPSNLNCTVSKPFTKSVPPKGDTCANHQAPNITGDIAISVGPNQATITSGNVGPAGGSFNPGLPQTISRPNAGQSPANFSTTYTLGYGPSALNCKTSKPFSKQIPAKEQTCEQQNPPQGNITTSSGDSTNFNAAARVYNNGEWQMQIRAASSQAECNADDPDYIKTTTEANLQCGQNRTLNSSYHWAGHPSEWWWVTLHRNGTRVARSGCTQNTRN